MGFPGSLTVKQSMNSNKSEHDEVQSSASQAATLPHDNKKSTNWALLKNGAVLAVGRNINSMLRLVIAAIIARAFGANTFAEYSLLLATMMIAEWLLDFGTTDVFVREVSKHKHEFTHKISTLFMLKGFQIPLGMALMITIISLLNPSSNLMLGGICASLGLVFYAFVSVYRAVFKARMTLEKEMLAEFISIVLMIPLIVLSFYTNAGIIGIALSLVLSRLIFLLCCIWLSTIKYLTIGSASIADAKQLWRASYVIGFIGLLSVVNNAAEILILSKLSTLQDVAIFSAAQKLVWPMFMILTAVGAVFYPVLASHWNNNRGQFALSAQNAFNIIALLGFLCFSGIYPGAEFMMGLISPELVAATDALQILLAMCLIKSFSAAMGPVLFIVGAEKAAFGYFVVSVAIKVLFISIFAEEYGYIGCALVSLAVEALVVFPCTLGFLRLKAQLRIKFLPTILIAISCLAVILLFEYFIHLPSALELVLSPILLLGIVVITKQASPSAILTIIRVRKDVS
jgi:O-antigen/teichoic acid export membrane protein